ncbi:hypothetical protein D3C85_1294980 [compost metagenome]
MHHLVAQGDGLARRQFADPVMRQVRPDQHQIARGEVADVVADEHLAAGRADQAQLVFPVMVPADQAAGHAMLDIVD